MQFKNVLRSAIAIGATSLLAVVGFTAPVSAANETDKTYVVIASNETNADGNALVTQFGGEVTQKFRAIHTRAARMKPSEAAALDAVPGVIVSENKTYTIADVQSPTPSWGLDRIDQVSLPLNSSFNYSATQQGSGVRAYIMDTGVLTSHQEFTGRIAGGYDAIGDGNGFVDCNGHGTHVAGTVAGSTVGVARQATVVPVRILNCAGSGDTLSIAAGVSYVLTDHAANPGPAVVNMSVGGPADAGTDALIKNLTDAGITTVVAAGNSNQNACNFSPARASSAITVGATSNTDSRASYSNYGSCLDIFAPGGDGRYTSGMIKSSYYSATNAYAWMSGTSMASPHVAGVVADYLGVNPNATPAQVSTAMSSFSTTGKVSSAGSGSVNRLLYLNPAGVGVAAAASPLGAPTSARATVTTAGNASITWTAPAANGETISYVVTPYNVSTATSGTPINASSTSATATGLIAGSTYTFSVVAKTATQTSSAATSNSIVATGLAQAPANFTVSRSTSTSAKLTWSALASGEPLGYSTLTRYEVARQVNGGAWSGWVSAKTSTSYTFSSQKAGNTYSYKVRAVTPAGFGAEATSSSFVQSSTSVRNGRTR